MQYKKRVLIVMTSLILVLFSCTQKEEIKKITWYVASESEWWIDSNEPFYTSIQSEHIDAVNKRLEELEKPYRLDIKVFPEELEESMSTAQETIKSIKDKDSTVDILCYENFWHNEFENLDTYMNSKQGKELRKQIPENLYQSIKVQSNVYMVPSLKYPVKQAAFVFLKEYYDKHKSELKNHMKSSMDMLDYLNHNYTREKGYILGNDFGYKISSLMFQEYDEIDGTPLYIRKRDKKIINPFEEKAFLDLYEVLAEINLKGFTGRNLSTEEMEEVQNNENYVFNFEDSYRIPEIVENDEQRSNPRSIELPLGSSSASKVMGYGVLKDSKNKKDAFDLLALVQTDAKLSNALIYGPNPQIENGKVKSKGHFAAEYFSSLGNNIIALPATIEATNKKDLFFKADRRVDSSIYVPIRLILDEYTQQIDKLNVVIDKMEPPNIIDASSTYTHLNSKEAVLKEIENVNKQLKEAGIDLLKTELQKQIDGGIK